MSTIAEAAEHLFMTAQNFMDLQKAGAIPRYPKNGVDIDDARKAYILHMRRRGAGRPLGVANGAGGGPPPPPPTIPTVDIADETAKLRMAQRKREELRLLKDEGSLAPIGEIHASDDVMMTAIRDRLLGVGMAITENVYEAAQMGDKHLVRALYEDAINDALEDISTAEVETEAADDERDDEGADEGLPARRAKPAGAAARRAVPDDPEAEAEDDGLGVGLDLPDFES